MSAPAVLRAAVLLLLGLALALPGAWQRRSGSVAPAWIENARALERQADSLLVGRAPPAIARASTEPPTAAELEILAAASGPGRAPLFAALPERRVSVQAEAPARAVAGRTAAIPFRVTAAPNDSVLVRLVDQTGVLDSLRVRVDGSGRYAGAFRARPPRGGWREWTVHAGTASARTGAWVDSAGPPRVLVRAGFPHWEAKFLVRALEESGAVVETAYDLGRGQFVVQGGSALSPERLARADAVVLLHSAPVGDGERRMLQDWATARGGGVLLAGAQARAGAFGLVDGQARARAVDGPALAWALPPELAPLPADRVRSGAVVYGGVRAGAAMAASVGDGGVLAMRPLGRGRVAALGLTETWRWRMEAGRVREHREFWRALVDWLASAPRDPLTVRVPQPVGPAGARREVVVYATSGASASVPPLLVTRPDRRADTVGLAADPARPGVLRGWFVPADTGLHTFAFAGRAPAAGYRATANGGAAEDGWARLAMLADASGGRMLRADSLRPVIRRLTPGDAAGGARVPLGWMLFWALLIAAGAEWAIRRMRGQA